MSKVERLKAKIENYTGPREPRAGEVFYLGVKGR